MLISGLQNALHNRLTRRSETPSARAAAPLSTAGPCLRHEARSIRRFFLAPINGAEMRRQGDWRATRTVNRRGEPEGDAARQSARDGREQVYGAITGLALLRARASCQPIRHMSRSRAELPCTYPGAGGINPYCHSYGQGKGRAARMRRLQTCHWNQQLAQFWAVLHKAEHDRHANVKKMKRC